MARQALPETAPPDFTITPLDDPKIQVDPKLADIGNAEYHKNCTGCTAPRWWQAVSATCVSQL